MEEQNRLDTPNMPEQPAPEAPAPAPEQPAPQPEPAAYTPQGGYAPYGYAHTSWQPAPEPPAPKKRGAGVLVTLLCILCAVSIAGTGIALAWAFGNRGNDSGSSRPPVSGTTSTTVNSNAPKLDITSTVDSTSWAKEAIQKVLPSTAVLTAYQGNTLAGFASGIVYSQDGYIITNAHCVYNADRGKVYDYIDVELYDGTVYEDARVCGYDTSTDLAVIKVEAEGLTPATFGSADSLVLGDYVVAVGNAGGLAWSASMGIVSGLNRDVYEDSGYAIPCLQVDAAINPGNSGGPLINAAGQVVGINSIKIVVEGYENLAFSIPINEQSKAIIDSLAYQGRVTGRVSLGILGQSVTTLHYEGFYITNVLSMSPLRDKVAIGDIIQYVDDVRVKSFAEMRRELAKNQVGDEVKLTLLHIDRRTGRESAYDVTIRLIDASETE